MVGRLELVGTVGLELDSSFKLASGVIAVMPEASATASGVISLTLLPLVTIIHGGANDRIYIMLRLLIFDLPPIGSYASKVIICGSSACGSVHTS